MLEVDGVVKRAIQLKDKVLSVYNDADDLNKVRELEEYRVEQQDKIEREEILNERIKKLDLNQQNYQLLFSLDYSQFLF